MLAMLAHERQRGAGAALPVTYCDFADPLCVRGRAVAGFESVLVVAGAYAGITARRAFAGVDEHAPALRAAGRLVRRPGNRQIDEAHARSQRQRGRRGTDAAEKLASRLASFPLVLFGPNAHWMAVSAPS
jgi:hypothetical protein